MMAAVVLGHGVPVQEAQVADGDQGARRIVDRDIDLGFRQSRGHETQPPAGLLGRSGVGAQVPGDPSGLTRARAPSFRRCRLDQALDRHRSLCDEPVPRSRGLEHRRLGTVGDERGRRTDAERSCRGHGIGAMQEDAVHVGVMVAGDHEVEREPSRAIVVAEKTKEGGAGRLRVLGECRARGAHPRLVAGLPPRPGPDPGEEPSPAGALQLTVGQAVPARVVAGEVALPEGIGNMGSSRHVTRRSQRSAPDDPSLDFCGRPRSAPHAVER